MEDYKVILIRHMENSQKLTIILCTVILYLASPGCNSKALQEIAMQKCP